MWPSPTWESDTHLHDRERKPNASIPCENGRVSIRATKTDSPPMLGLGMLPQWELTYTLRMDDIDRTKTIGYVSAYEDAVSLIRSYVDAITSERIESEQLDALDVVSRLNDLSPPESEPMIVGIDDLRNRNTNKNDERRPPSTRPPL